MLSEIVIENFRCFERHTIPFRKNSIVVGKNNAGKSTIVEALRLISIVANKYENSRFQSPPKWLSVPLYYRGMCPSIAHMGFDFRTIFHRYGTPPAKIVGKFKTGGSIVVYVGEEDSVFAMVFDKDGNFMQTKGEAKKLRLPSVQILPQVAPFLKEEKILDSEHVRGLTSSSRSPHHFRNQLKLYPSAYKRFEDLVENTWKGLRLESLGGKNGSRGDKLSLIVRDGDFAAEVGCMGHGLQIWFQTLWFLSRCHKADTIILDEPDVYLHPDLQRKLIKILKDEYSQVIIATHSVEILSEVEPRDVLIINRQKSHSRFADSLLSVQNVIDNIGGVHNLQLTRLGYARKCIYVEGKDMKFLKIIHNKLFPQNETLDLIPNMAVGGWGGWSLAIGAATFLNNETENTITPYCIFDRDYHSESEIEERYEKAEEKGIKLHVWKMKEIENYFLVPSAIRRVIIASPNERQCDPRKSDIEEQLRIITEDLYDSTMDVISTEIHSKNKGDAVSKANATAREYLNKRWDTLDKRLSVVSGKEVFSRLSRWSKKIYGVSISVEKVAYMLHSNEIHTEMKEIIEMIEEGDLSLHN